MRLIVALTAVAMLAVTGACNDSPGPERGVFVLRTVGDSTLPFVEYAADYDRITVLADTLTLDGRGHSTETSVIRRELNGQAPTVTPWTTNRAYVVRGDTIVLPFVCGPPWVCTASSGTVRMVLVQGGMASYYSPAGPPLSRYERIR